MNRKNTRYIDKLNAHCDGGTLSLVLPSLLREGRIVMTIGFAVCFMLDVLRR